MPFPARRSRRNRKEPPEVIPSKAPTDEDTGGDNDKSKESDDDNNNDDDDNDNDGEDIVSHSQQQQKSAAAVQRRSKRSRKPAAKLIDHNITNNNSNTEWKGRTTRRNAPASHSSADDQPSTTTNNNNKMVDDDTITGDSGDDQDADDDGQGDQEPLKNVRLRQKSSKQDPAATSNKTGDGDEISDVESSDQQQGKGALHKATTSTDNHDADKSKDHTVDDDDGEDSDDDHDDGDEDSSDNEPLSQKLKRKRQSGTTRKKKTFNKTKTSSKKTSKDKRDKDHQQDLEEDSDDGGDDQSEGEPPSKKRQDVGSKTSSKKSSKDQHDDGHPVLDDGDDDVGNGNQSDEGGPPSKKRQDGALDLTHSVADKDDNDDDFMNALGSADEATKTTKGPVRRSRGRASKTMTADGKSSDDEADPDEPPLKRKRGRANRIRRSGNASSAAANSRRTPSANSTKEEEEQSSEESANESGSETNVPKEVDMTISKSDAKTMTTTTTTTSKTNHEGQDSRANESQHHADAGRNKSDPTLSASKTDDKRATRSNVPVATKDRHDEDDATNSGRDKEGGSSPNELGEIKGVEATSDLEDMPSSIAKKEASELPNSSVPCDGGELPPVTETDKKAFDDDAAENKPRAVRRMSEAESSSQGSRRSRRKRRRPNRLIDDTDISDDGQDDSKTEEWDNIIIKQESVEGSIQKLETIPSDQEMEDNGDTPPKASSSPLEDVGTSNDKILSNETERSTHKSALETDETNIQDGLPGDRSNPVELNKGQTISSETRRDAGDVKNETINDLKADDGDNSRESNHGDEMNDNGPSDETTKESEYPKTDDDEVVKSIRTQPETEIEKAKEISSKPESTTPDDEPMVESTSKTEEKSSEEDLIEVVEVENNDTLASHSGSNTSNHVVLSKGLQESQKSKKTIKQSSSGSDNTQANNESTHDVFDMAIERPTVDLSEVQSPNNDGSGELGLSNSGESKSAIDNIGKSAKHEANTSGLDHDDADKTSPIEDSKRSEINPLQLSTNVTEDKETRHTEMRPEAEDKSKGSETILDPQEGQNSSDNSAERLGDRSSTTGKDTDIESHCEDRDKNTMGDQKPLDTLPKESLLENETAPKDCEIKTSTGKDNESDKEKDQGKGSDADGAKEQLKHVSSDIADEESDVQSSIILKNSLIGTSVSENIPNASVMTHATCGHEAIHHQPTPQEMKIDAHRNQSDAAPKRLVPDLQEELSPMNESSLVHNDYDGQFSENAVHTTKKDSKSAEAPEMVKNSETVAITQEESYNSELRPTLEDPLQESITTNEKLIDKNNNEDEDTEVFHDAQMELPVDIVSSERLVKVVVSNKETVEQLLQQNHVGVGNGKRTESSREGTTRIDEKGAEIQNKSPTKVKLEMTNAALGTSRDHEADPAEAIRTFEAEHSAAAVSQAASLPLTAIATAKTETEEFHNEDVEAKVIIPSTLSRDSIERDVSHLDLEILPHTSAGVPYTVKFGPMMSPEEVGKEATSSGGDVKTTSKLNRVKALLYRAGSKVHRGRGCERIFAEYWDAMMLRLSDRLPGHVSKRCDKAIYGFLKTKQLRKMHNKFIMAILSQIANDNGHLRAANLLPGNLRCDVNAKESKRRVIAAVAVLPSSQENINDFLQVKSIYREAWYDHQVKEEVDGNQRRRQKVQPAPNLEHFSSCIPGAIHVDPAVRNAAKDHDMEASDLAIWLMVVAIKEHTLSILKASVSQKEALANGDFAPSLCNFPKVLASMPKTVTKKDGPADGSKSSTTERGGFKMQKRLTPFDIYVGSGLMPSGSLGSLGGALSRDVSELSLHASFEQLPISTQDEFFQVQQFLANQILEDARTRKIAPKADREPTKQAEQQVNVKFSEAKEQASSNPVRAKVQIHAKPVALEQRNIGPIEAKEQRISHPIEAREKENAHSPIESKEQRMAHPVEVKAEDSAGPIDAKPQSITVPTQAPVLQNKVVDNREKNPTVVKPDDTSEREGVAVAKNAPVGVPRGMGRGAKNLAALMQRATSSPAVEESVSTQVKDEAIVSVQPSGAVGDKSDAMQSAKVEGGAHGSKDDGSSADAEMDLSSSGHRRGKGFGIKNLAAMRARASNKDQNDGDKQSSAAPNP